VVVVEPARYSYVTAGGFQSTGYYNRDVIVTGPRAVAIHGQTSELASASYVGGHAVVPVHAGPSPTVIGQASGHPVVPVQASSLHAVSPPANQKGVHYVGGGSASHPFAAKPMPQAVAKQYLATQPKAAQTAFHEHLAATKGGIQPGRPLATTPATRTAPNERAGNAARPEGANEAQHPQEAQHPPEEHAAPAAQAHPAPKPAAKPKPPPEKHR
jgi:hypothetical protein